ncbi:MAG: hypothetical protein JWM43_3138 [Acidobacteriaceae bacterium]|nr:hypothetical protein [Acidobacteriaceae bacterium]
MVDVILLAATRGNPATILKEAATTEAIASKVRQEFVVKEKA